MDPFDLVETDAELLTEVCGITTLGIPSQQVTPADIAHIESRLPLYDHVAFAFLAYDDQSRALERINDALGLAKNKRPWHCTIISSWFNSEGHRSSRRLIEILWLLQNWELLRMLGVGRNTVRVREVDPYRLALFQVIEKLDDKKLSDVARKVAGEASIVEYAEILFLTWLQEGKISPRDSSRFIRALRDVGLQDESERLEIMTGKLPVSPSAEQTGREPHSLVMTPPVSMNEPIYQVQTYMVNPETAGLCLIFNQRNFNQSIDLPNRLGTEVDCQRLEWTFRMFGYEVVVFTDRTSSEIISDIHTFSRTDFSKYDSLVLCILSHGVEGAVYGSDGREVKVRNLALNFASDRCPSLNQKPKLIFVQACQGVVNQAPVRVEPYQDIATDGPESHPAVCDFFEAWATISGFVSYRSKSRGSVFVRALCDVLEQTGHEQGLDDVMKLVHSEVGRQEHKTSVNSSIHKQTPVYTSCLTKNMKFKRHQEYFIDTAIERLEEHLLNVLIKLHLLYAVPNQGLNVPF